MNARSEHVHIDMETPYPKAARRVGLLTALIESGAFDGITGGRQELDENGEIIGPDRPFNRIHQRDENEPTGVYLWPFPPIDFREPWILPELDYLARRAMVPGTHYSYVGQTGSGKTTYAPRPYLGPVRVWPVKARGWWCWTCRGQVHPDPCTHPLGFPLSRPLTIVSEPRCPFCLARP